VSGTLAGAAAGTAAAGTGSSRLSSAAGWDMVG
jgi:hypothetical protein